MIEIKRKTNETNIELSLDIRGTAQRNISTGIGFFDHMLDLFAFQSQIDIDIKAEGDLHIDAHHTIEDVGICLGQALAQSLTDKAGIARYAHCYLPMDETLTRTVLDISGRAYHVFHGSFNDSMVGAFPTEITKHFFGTVAHNAAFTLHQEIIYGEGDHHKIESLFKGFGRCLKNALEITSPGVTPSTKGML